jgi:phage baseplate assembly protein W
MQGYSPKLPLTNDPIDGKYALNKTLLDTIKQNFKMLLLTNPGERIMMPDFGVGIRTFIFDQDTESVRNIIKNRISEQVKRYMSFIIV